MKPLALILCLTLCGCYVPVVPDASEYHTRAVMVDFDDQTVDVDWIKYARKAGEVDMCGTFHLDYKMFQNMTDEQLFAAIVANVKDSDIKLGAACAKKGK